MGDYGVDNMGYGLKFTLAFGVCFAQCTLDKTILLVCHSRADILVGTEVVAEVLSLLLADVEPL